MAEHELEVTFTWENAVAFDMQAKKDSNPAITILHVDENGHIKNLWPHIKKTVVTYLENELDGMGTEMMQ